jgi:DNA-binding CsgD family transcriptional regulator
MRTLYQHTARASLATRAFVRQVVAEGAEVRTTGEPFERVFFFDGRIAVVSQERRGRQAPGAAIVSEPTLVNFMYRTFENIWQSAQVFDADRVEYQETAEELRTNILRLMAAGLKDDVIARRLGMATRTCRRYITELMDEIDASSRFQAGLIVGRRGLLPDDGPPGPADDDPEAASEGGSDRTSDDKE